MKILSSVTVVSLDNSDYYYSEVTMEDGSTLRVRIFFGDTIQDAVDRELSSN